MKNGLLIACKFITGSIFLRISNTKSSRDLSTHMLHIHTLKSSVCL